MTAWDNFAALCRIVAFVSGTISLILTVVALVMNRKAMRDFRKLKEDRHGT